MHTRQRAHIAHSIPGRIRIVVPSKRHCAHFFARMERHVVGAHGVRGVHSRPAAASIVIQYEPGSNCLAICAVILELDPPNGVRPTTSPSTVLLALQGANLRLHRLTGGRFDLAWLLARALLFVVRKHSIAKLVELAAEPLLRLLLTIDPEVRRPVPRRPLSLAA